MNLHNLAPAHVVMIYFACFALGWTILAMTTLDAELSAGAAKAAHPDYSISGAIGVEAALALHAGLIALLAWKAQRWFYGHGASAVAVSGVPLLVLLRELWFVPAFLYLIAVLYVWLASRRETLGHVQATHHRSIGKPVL